MKHIPAAKLTELKEKLEAEKARLAEGLSQITRTNPTNPEDWTVKNDEAEGETADKNDQGDALEDLEENIAIAQPLEGQLKDVEDALKKIDDGTYGIDENTGEPISVERLQANPSARTNI